MQVRTEGNNVILTVKDSGSGVPQEVLERFWKTGHVGVGLAGIRERLKELGGFLEIESNADGTTLTGTIPLPAAGGNNSDPDEVSPSFRKYSSVLPMD